MKGQGFSWSPFPQAMAPGTKYLYVCPLQWGTRPERAVDQQAGGTAPSAGGLRAGVRQPLVLAQASDWL